MLALLLRAAFAASYLDWQAQLPVEPHPEAAYHFAADVHAALAPLVAERPGVIVPFEVGRSGEDRPIWGFRIHDPGTPVRRRLLVFANIHAMEWVPTEVATAFGVEMATHPPPGLEITLIPTLNVDGRAKVEADLREGKNTFRRGNAAKVDLNRDFAVNRDAKAVWRHIIPSRYRTSDAPLSQPESRAIDALAAATHFDVAISLHAFGGFIYYPWAGLFERAPDWKAHHEIGTLMQSGMGAHACRPRQLSRWGFFFRGHGMTDRKNEPRPPPTGVPARPVRQVSRGASTDRPGGGQSDPGVLDRVAGASAVCSLARRRRGPRRVSVRARGGQGDRLRHHLRRDVR